MSLSTRSVKRHAKASKRRRLKVQERLERDRRQAQQAAEALEEALHDLGLPANLVAEIEGRLRSQQKLLGKIVGVMFPPLFGCRTHFELCRVRGWDKNLPSRLLGALPKRSWLKRLRRLGLEVLLPLWRHTASKSAATRSRWQWTWVGDDSVLALQEGTCDKTPFVAYRTGKRCIAASYSAATSDNASSRYTARLCSAV
jgi:hypothetical protein